MGKLHRLEVRGREVTVIEQPRRGELTSLLARSPSREARFVLDGDRLYVMDAHAVLHTDLRKRVAPALDLTPATNGNLYQETASGSLVVTAVPSQCREHVRRAEILHRLARPGRLCLSSTLDPDTPTDLLDPDAEQDADPHAAVVQLWQRETAPRLRALADTGHDGSNAAGMLTGKAQDYLQAGPPSFVDDGGDWLASRMCAIRMTRPGYGAIRLGACETGFVCRDGQPGTRWTGQPAPHGPRLVALESHAWRHGDGEIDVADRILLESEIACAMAATGFEVRIQAPGTLS